MKIVSLPQAKLHLSRLLEEAVSGKEILIARSGKPLVRLVPVPEPHTRRTFGTARGLIHMSEDFDEPLDGFGD